MYVKITCPTTLTGAPTNFRMFSSIRKAPVTITITEGGDDGAGVEVDAVVGIVVEIVVGVVVDDDSGSVVVSSLTLSMTPLRKLPTAIGPRTGLATGPGLGTEGVGVGVDDGIGVVEGGGGGNTGGDVDDCATTVATEEEEAVVAAAAAAAADETRVGGMVGGLGVVGRDTLDGRVSSFMPAATAVVVVAAVAAAVDVEEEVEDVPPSSTFFVRGAAELAPLIACVFPPVNAKPAFNAATANAFSSTPV